MQQDTQFVFEMIRFLFSFLFDLYRLENKQQYKPHNCGFGLHINITHLGWHGQLEKERRSERQTGTEGNTIMYKNR